MHLRKIAENRVFTESWFPRLCKIRTTPSAIPHLHKNGIIKTRMPSALNSYGQKAFIAINYLIPVNRKAIIKPLKANSCQES